MSTDLLDTMILDFVYRIGLGEIDKEKLPPKLLEEVLRASNKKVLQCTHILSISELLKNISQREGDMTLDESVIKALP